MLCWLLGHKMDSITDQEEINFELAELRAGRPFCMIRCPRCDRRATVAVPYEWITRNYPKSTI